MNKCEFRRRLVRVTYCSIQHTGWPCGTCFSTIPKLPEKRANELWQSVLAYRGDYSLASIEQTQEQVDRNIIELNALLEEK